MGSANSMRYMISVTASTPYRYASLTIMALPENAIAPRVASSRPRCLAAKEEWERVIAFIRLVFYGVVRIALRLLAGGARAQSFVELTGNCEVSYIYRAH